MIGLWLLAACGTSDTRGPVPPLALPTLPPPVLVRPGATGVVLRSAAGLEVVFPAGEVEGFDPFDDARIRPGVMGELVWFDAEGELGRQPPPPLQTTFWCENDGGVQHRLAGSVEPPALARPLPTTPGVVAFVRVGEAPGGALVSHPETGAVVVGVGDVDADGGPDASLVGYPDEATCEDGNLDLVSPRGVSPLRCCGP